MKTIALSMTAALALALAVATTSADAATAAAPAAAPAAPAATPATPAAKKPRTAQSLECSKKADAANIHGKPRKSFMSKCKAGKA